MQGQTQKHPKGEAARPCLFLFYFFLLTSISTLQVKQWTTDNESVHSMKVLLFVFGMINNQLGTQSVKESCSQPSVYSCECNYI